MTKTNTPEEQATLIMQWSAQLNAHRRTLSWEGDCLSPGREQEDQEEESLQDFLEVRAANPDSRMGETWSLAILGFKSPAWILGIQHDTP